MSDIWLFCSNTCHVTISATPLLESTTQKLRVIDQDAPFREANLTYGCSTGAQYHSIVAQLYRTRSERQEMALVEQRNYGGHLPLLIEGRGEVATRWRRPVGAAAGDLRFGFGWRVRKVTTGRGRL